MEGKKERPKPRKVNDNKEDVPTQHEAESVMFKSELPIQLIEFPNFPPPFLAGTPIIFLIASLKGITYACIVSSSFE